MANSTTDAEYIVAFNVAKEVVWIKKFIIELTLFQVLQTQWNSIVITMEQLHKLRNLNFTENPNIYFSASILSVRLLIEEM